jgi:hypothetical protein
VREVVDKGRFLIETHLQTGRPIAELARAHGVHHSWLYKRLARYRVEGEAGLEPRSRRPHCSPTRIADRYIGRHSRDPGVSPLSPVEMRGERSADRV